MHLVLFRHAAVKSDPHAPPRSWGLTDEGWRAAAILGKDSALDTVSVLATSPEPKAAQTAVALGTGKPTIEVDDLGELDRSAAGWLAREDERLELVREILARPDES